MKPGRQYFTIYIWSVRPWKTLKLEKDLIKKKKKNIQIGVWSSLKKYPIVVFVKFVLNIHLLCLGGNFPKLDKKNHAPMTFTKPVQNLYIRLKFWNKKTFPQFRDKMKIQPIFVREPYRKYLQKPPIFTSSIFFFFWFLICWLICPRKLFLNFFGLRKKFTIYKQLGSPC